MEKDSRVWRDRLIVSLLVLVAIWTVKVVELQTQSSFSHYGVLPRTLVGLRGVLLMPLLHRDVAHLAANSVPLFVLTLALLNFYPKVSLRFMIAAPILCGALVWGFARQSFHIGASGVIYALAAFLFFSGVFRRDRKSMGAAMIVAFLYGSMVWGVLPIYPETSWEGHLFGAISGWVLAILWRNVDRPQPPEWPDEEDDNEVDQIPWQSGYRD